MIELRVLAFFFLLSLQAADSAPADGETDGAVEARLKIPEAETYVIGDPIPLIWEFTNRSSEPLAFMWEGCCRLNGRLTVQALDQSVPTIPPGQALAHMFAKAEVLEPQVPAEFETFLSDWVDLQQSGTYQLQGRYVGVLPSQQPQVPEDVKLWLDAAHTDPIDVSLVSPNDYLRERDERADARNLQLELSGPSRLSVLDETQFDLALLNTSSKGKEIRWPSDVRLWVLDENGHRVGNIPMTIEADYEHLQIAPGAAVDRIVRLPGRLLEGKQFGRYRIFLDLLAGEGAGGPRLPSNAVAVEWKLTEGDVRELVAAAAQGPQRGFRNAPLKLLRVHLGEIGQILESLPPESVDPAASELVKELAQAACLKPLALQPGTVELRMAIDAGGTLRFQNALFERCLSEPGPSPEVGPSIIAMVEGLFQLRRHLGWDLNLILEPAPETATRHILAAVQDLRSKLGPSFPGPVIEAPLPKSDLPATFQFDARAQPRFHLRLELGSPGSAPVLLVAEAPRTSTRRDSPPGEVEELAWAGFADAARFEAFVKRHDEVLRDASVEVNPEISFEALIRTLHPMLRPGRQVDLVVPAPYDSEMTERKI